MRRILAVGAMAALVASAQELTPAERKASIDSFEKVWTTVRDKHWDPKYNGVDWQAVHDELRPKVETAKDKAAVREVLNDMVGRLRQTHFGIFPAEVYHDLDSKAMAKESGDANSDEAHPGIDVRVLEGHAIVTEVEPGSPAATKGVKTGWEIKRVGETEIEPVLARISKQFGDSTLLDLRLERAVESRLQGKTGSTVQVDFLDGANRKVTFDLQRVKPRGKAVQVFNLPVMYFWSEWRKTPANIGCVRFNIFMEPELLAGTMSEAMKGCRECKGFIIDVRGNPGGLGALAMTVAGYFVEKSGLQLGTMYLRGPTLKFFINPRLEPFRGPVAILVDGNSASTAEILAGGMKDIGRARIFGTRTAGAALPSVIDRLPNGDGFQYAIANYISEGGNPLEGIGVIPDEVVRPTRGQLLDGLDPVMDAATHWIGKQVK